MSKGTAAMGKRQKKNHILCRRCGKHSYHATKKRCSACGFGATKKIRTYSWQWKARDSKGNRLK
jgi:large subunit ribosomal protein L37e